MQVWRDKDDRAHRARELVPLALVARCKSYSSTIVFCYWTPTQSQLRGRHKGISEIDGYRTNCEISLYASRTSPFSNGVITSHKSLGLSCTNEYFNTIKRQKP